MVNIVGGVMGSGDRHLPNFLRRRPHLLGGEEWTRDKHHDPQQQQRARVPKGCLGVMVGREGEEQQRFVVPVAYLKHPRFAHLLKESADEYGFRHGGAIAIPCLVEEFRAIQGLIDRELFGYPDHHVGSGSTGGGGGHHHHSHHHHNILGCFRA